jgi:phosphoglycolate phosphatase-like HAD superfamily hydrolase
MRSLRIALDIDDVLVESLPEYLRRFCLRFGCTLPVADAAWEIFRRYPEIPSAAMWEFYAELDRTDFLATRPAYPDAVEGIRQLAGAGHRLYVVTGRLPEHRGHTRRLLEREALLGLFQEVVHRDGPEPAAEYKPRVIRERGLELLIDDELHVALAAAAIPVPVLLVDRPWNAGDLPPGVDRVRGWEEIALRVKALADAPRI